MKNNDDKREKEIYKVTFIGSLVNLFLIALKFITGILGNSSAMIADAMHSLSDFATDFIVIIFVKVSSKPKDEDHDYGHGKFETLASLLISVVLLAVGVGIAWSGLKSIVAISQGESLPSVGSIALVGALSSILLKELLYRYSIVKARKVKSDALIANAWHHRSDAFSSIASAIGIGGAIILGEKWAVLDPLAGVLVSFFIIRTAIKLAKPSLDELLEKSLSNQIKNDIRKTVSSFSEVTNLHNLRTRKIGSYYAIEFHIRTNGEKSLKEAHDLITEIEKKLKLEYGEKTHVIIHIEPI